MRLARNDIKLRRFTLAAVRRKAYSLPER
jgi:hypothetical protein